VCRKIYAQDIVPDNFIDPNIDKFYPKKDYHRMYVGEIRRCLSK
ncbi:MAG TPA: flavin reductase, partial [Syntrophorhabdus aromaticivorans]|nr:flavin reductase [Syntrophorhabdus aromaticivorans]